MKKFAFKLNPLLRLRRNQRDLARQLLAEVLRHDDALVKRRRQTETDRLVQIDELRELSSAGNGVNIDASTSRRFYAAQLSVDLGEIDAQRAALAQRIELCRQSLVHADQAVQALERLAEKQQAEFVFAEERREARTLEEAWQAIHAGEFDQC